MNQRMTAEVAPKMLQADRLESGDPAADVTSFVRKYQDLVVNTCNHFLGDADEAHDVAQQVFVASLEMLDRITIDDEWRAWLYRAAVNRSLNALRARKRRSWLSSLTARRGQGIDPGNVADRRRPDRELEIAELRRALEEAVAKLPRRQRVAFILNRHEGLSNSEIAAVMEIRVTAVDSLLQRALAHLRKRLLRHYEELRQP